MSQKNSLTIGLVIAICGTFVLGADRMTASADANSILGQSVTHFTIIGVALLVLAAIWFFIFNRQDKRNKTK
jgi:LPXTG-motif cell wall-anchored protein